MREQLETPVKLSELNSDTQLFIESDNGYYIDIIDKDDFIFEVQESWRDYSPDTHILYIAEPMPLQVNKRTLLGDILERYEDDQYEDWAQDMYDDLEDSPIVDSFVAELNKAAAGRVTYYPGTRVEVDIDFKATDKPGPDTSDNEVKHVLDK